MVSCPALWQAFVYHEIDKGRGLGLARSDRLSGHLKNLSRWRFMSRLRRSDSMTRPRTPPRSMRSSG